MFDGAAAVAVEQQAPAAVQGDAPASAPATLVVIDSRVSNAAQLAAEAGKDKSAQVVMVGHAEDGLAAISSALENAGKVDAIQVYSHGAAGQFTLGSRNISADNIAASGSELGSWAGHLSADADILLFGCNVGAGDSGRALIAQLAALTSADVAASVNDTGSAAAGGDWNLEVASGSIESAVPVLTYDGLLADASPTVALSAANLDTLLGGQLTFTATFTNSDLTQAGYAPFIDLILPATGKDGAGVAVDDGITFISATYLGQTVKSFVLTFDAAGNATHPLAKDATGQPVIINAATYGAQPGDQLVVLQLPYASVINGQPAIPVVITAQLSDLADTDNSPNLTIKARGGFQFGNDSADNPTADPTLFQASMQNLVVRPTGLTLTQTVNMPEGETATGPNYTRSLTVTATPPPGQTLTNVEVTQSLPDTIRIRSITPGAGGTLSSITVGGYQITDPVRIAQVLSGSPYLTEYTVTYASLTAPASTVVGFYVGETDPAGNPILDPVSGDDRTITLAQPTATAQWVPLDVRDQVVDPGPPPVVVPVNVVASGATASFVAKSVTLHKTVSIASNAGAAGITPGDTLQYTLELNLSDYFAMGKTLFGHGSLTIADQLGDGQTLVGGSPVMMVDFQGGTYAIPLVSTSGAQGPGGTALSFDIAQSLINNDQIAGGALIGDIIYDGLLEGATRVVITYRSTVGQSYATAYPQSEINEGDAIGNSATLSGEFLRNPIFLTGGSETDTSSASLTVPTHSVQGSILSVNGTTPPANGELKPGDIVTFKLAYNLETGDYENFKLSAYLPLPLFDLTGLPLTQGSGVGQWTYGAGNTNVDLVNGVSVGPGNSLIFDFGNYATSNLTGSRIEVQFTLAVGNKPFADQRSLTVLAQSDQLTTIPTQQHLVSSGIINIASVAEPVLAIKHGVVSVGAGSLGVVSGTTGSWAAAGSSGAPFVGSVTDLLAVEGNVINIDGGDLVRLATAIENTGGLGAYDVATSVTLPAGFSFVGGSLLTANTKVYRGDGTALLAGTDYSISGTTITFLDNGGPGLLPGRLGTANDNSGANLVVITYDVITSATIAASQSLQTSAAVTNYSGVDNGPDFTPVDIADSATENVAAPLITKFFANGSISDDDSSAAHTSGADLVVGESMLYDIVVTLPEGQTHTLRLTDLIPAGLHLDLSFASSGYQLITTVAESAALTSDFLGTVVITGVASTPSGSLGADSVDARLTFSAATATADNNQGNNSFVVRLRLIAGNVSSNQAGASRSNIADLIYSDPDGDTPNGVTPVDRSVVLSGSHPTVTVREPTLSITQTATTSTGNPGQVDAGDTVTYTITIRNGTASSDFNAFDLSFTDNLPTELDNLVIQSVVSSGGATATASDFALTGRALSSIPGANIDIPKGGVITLTITGLVNASVASVADFTNTANVQWTSLDGSDNTPQANERVGTGGINDYHKAAARKLLVVSGATISHVGGLADTPAPNPTSHEQTVAVGEIIRYRVAFVLAEGNTIGATIKVAIPDGLSFVNDGTAAIGLLSNTPITHASDLTTGANPDIAGSITSLPQTLLAADLSNTMTALVDAGRINIGDPRSIVFSLGDLVNTDGDADKEVIYLDFNVRVDNSAAVDTTKSLSTSAKFYSHGGATQLDKTQAIVEHVVEPNLHGLQKVVTDFNPNTAGATGTATVSLSFSNSGDGIAYDTHLIDTMADGSNYVLQSVIINGTTYLPASLPAGVTVSAVGGITADFSSLAIGATVKLIYTVDVPNSAVHAATNATLTWSSLPEAFTGYANTPVGVDGTTSGERDASGGVNNYIVSEGAGLGLITGTLWDDTASATASATPDGAGLAGQTVTLTWSGVDNDLATLADNRTFTATTDGNGVYKFGVLAAGNYRIDAVNPVNSYIFGADTDRLVVRIDSNAGDALAAATVSALGEGATAAANFGYVRDNDAPVNTLPGAQTTLEDTMLSITGISVADVDAGLGDLTVSLSVLHGTLNLTTTGVTSSGVGTATVTIQGNAAALNVALATLQYTPLLNYNGSDHLTVTTSDLGNSGDANGNLTPNEPGDALSDTDTLLINITAVNDAPQGVNDSFVARENGGWYNDVLGFVGAGNVLGNDTDVDIATNGDALKVTTIGQGATTINVATGPVPTTLAGVYGTLRINSLGIAVYEIDNGNATVQALRLAGQTLSETFTYGLSDIAGATSSATLTVTIQGANDTPVGVDDVGTATEAGGVANGTGGTPATGNVLTNDTDVDGVANGETKNVTGIRFKKEGVGGVMTGVASGTPGVSVGSYGTLTMNFDGSYTYVVNQSATAVQRMVAGDTLVEYFSYQVTDAAGDTDIAQIQININGANDNPVASNDRASAQAASTNGSAQELNPTGNVIRFGSQPATDPDPGNGVDSDVDRSDQPNTVLRVTAIRTGAESGSGTAGTVGTALAGLYGTLTINADGSFSYDVDSTNATVIALASGATLTDTFTYQLSDTANLTDLGELKITVRGVNDPPVAQDVFAVAVEKGGIADATPGLDPSGDALANDYDPDGNPITVTAIRTGTEAGSGTAGVVGSALTGAYGALTLNANGTYSYVLNNALAAVKELRTSSDTLTEIFTYTEADNQGEQDQAEIIIEIRGQNDNPVGVDDAATAIEAGGLANGAAGSNPLGNVLTNDTDDDAVAYGETKEVLAFRTGAEAASGTAGTLGGELRGTYGWLRLNANGSYTYRVDNDMAAVQALRSTANTLSETFTYTVQDADQTSDLAQLVITIQGANDTPHANPDTALAVEAGGTGNATPGTNPTGNLLTNDTDVDAAVNGETKAIFAFSNNASGAGTIGSALPGTYGSLTLNADGSYAYVVDNANPVVQALRLSGNTLSEEFSYTMTDAAGATSTSTLTVTIRGANDTPVAINDIATAIEAGGIANATPGINPTGNVLSNDTDVDSAAYGETKTVAAVAGGTVGAARTGTYGTLTLNADGSYSYVVDNANASVQALRLLSDTLTETFTYTMRDTAGAVASAMLTVTIRGANDNPVAVDNFGLAAAPTPTTAGRNPFGNVLPNDTDVDSGDSKTVTGIRAGTELAGGSLTTVTAGTTGSTGQVITGDYGDLKIGADGSYTYTVDAAKTAALRPTEIVNDYFTYQVTDAGGLTDLAQYRVILRGSNYPPVAQDEFVVASEAGGVANGTPGLDPTGDALALDFDAEGDALTVTLIRTGPEAGSGTSGTVGAPLRGQFGWLTLNPDGTYQYVVDNTLAAVEALRTSSDTLTDTFTYTVADSYDATDQAAIIVTIQGANDTPVAGNDVAEAIEAGGLANSTPGSNATGNVLTNDSDVDAYGETGTVTTIVSPLGATAGAGSLSQGRYGALTLNADGSYTYVIDNNNPAVQALRTPADTLGEVFTYTLSDRLGALSTATLSITLHGANDNPVATDDRAEVSDQSGPPITSGNVLPNDGDVDRADSKTVVAIRAGGEAGTGVSGVVGAPIQGAYGSLLINANGAYTYTVDMTNPEVQQAAGRGRVLEDVFTYTVGDTASATDQAELRISLDIAAPHQDFPASPFFGTDDSRLSQQSSLLNFTPVVYVERIVELIQRNISLSDRRNEGARPQLAAMPEIQAQSIGAGLGIDRNIFVQHGVRGSQYMSHYDASIVDSRAGRVTLSADGLLSDGSLFTPDDEEQITITRATPKRVAAPSFSEQLQKSAEKIRPLNAVQRLAAQNPENPRRL